MNQIDAGVQELVPHPWDPVEHTVGRGQLSSGRSISAQPEASMWLETAIDAGVGARQDGGLPHGMAEYAVQKEEPAGVHIAVAAIYLVYASAPIRCSDTYGSSPMTRLPCPGGI